MSSVVQTSLLWATLTIPPASALNGASDGAAQRQLSVAGNRAVVPLTYGEDRIGGLLLNVLPAGTNSPTLLVQVLWGFALDAINDPRLNDRTLPAGSTVTHYTGSQSTADAALVAAFAAQGITYSSTLAGFAYSVIAMPTRLFDGQLNVTARLRGRKLYDPRKDSTAGGTGAHRLATPSTWEWSDCPTLANADYLSNAVYGAGEAVDWSTVGPAADANDLLVGGEKRRLIGLSFMTATRVADVSEVLRAHGGNFIRPGASGVRFLPDADASASASYDHAAGDIAAIQPLSLRDNAGAPTAVEVVYTDTSKVPWRDNSATATLPGAGTTKPWRLSQVRMAGVQRFSQANREAVERLNKLTLQDLSTAVEVFDVGIRHEAGDIVNITHPVGLSAKPFRVTGVDMPAAGRWALTLVEHDPASYSTAVVTAPTIPDTSLVSSVGPPGVVTGLVALPVLGGALIRWDANQQRDYYITELRYGASWAAGITIWAGAAISFEWAPPIGATPLVWAAHINLSGEVGTPVSVPVTITAGVCTGLAAAFIGPDLRLDWVGTPGTFLIDRFEIRFGTTWAGATPIGDYKVTRLDRRVDWQGLRRWWVAAIDASGAVGTPVSIDVTVTEPGAVTAARSEIVDNNVLLYWSPPNTGSLPVERYEVRKGPAWVGGQVIGSNGNSTFAAVFEQQAGTFVYWVASYDSAGNVGAPVAITAVVSQPPDYVLRANLDDDFVGATLSGLYLEDGRVYGPALLETIQTHFESRGWASVDAQILAGFPAVFQPSGTSGFYERVVDYGVALPSTVITATPITAVLSGAVTMVVQLSYKALAGDPWIDAPVGATQALAGNFRFVKVRLTFTAAGGDDLLELSALNIKLSSKLKTDSGSGTANSADSGGTTVSFGTTFLDVSSIVVTPSGTAARYAIYDFLDAPNPTSFKVLLFNSAGARVSGDFSWTARGF